MFLLHVPCWLFFFLFFFFKSGEFLLLIPCWLELYLGSFTYTPSARFIVLWGVSLTHPMLALSFYLGLHFYVGSFSYTSRAGFIFIWGASLTHAVQDYFFFSFLISGEFLLHIPCWLHVYVRSFSYTSWVLGSFFYASNACFTFMWGVSLTHPVLVFIFMWGVSLTHPVLASFFFFYLGSFSYTSHAICLFYFLSWEFLLHIPCWLELFLGSFTSTPSARFIFLWGVSLTRPMLAFFFFFLIWGVSLTDPMLAWIVSGEFYLHTQCSLHCSVGSFSYTSHAGFIVLSGASFLCGKFLLHISCWLHFYLGSFSYTCRAGLLFLFFFNIWGVSLTHPVLASCLCEEFLLHIPGSGEFLLRIQCLFHFYVGSFSYTSRAGFIFMGGVSLTHPVLASFFSSFFIWGVSLTRPMLFVYFLSWEFLLHIPCWLELFLGSFTSTPSTRFIFLWGVSLTRPMLAFFFFFFFLIWGVSLTDPMLAWIVSGEFYLHTQCSLHCSVGSFSYTSHAGFIVLSGASFLCGKFLLHISCWLHFYLGSFSYTNFYFFFFFLSFFFFSFFIWGVSLTHPVLASWLCEEFLLHIPSSGEFLLRIQCWFHFYVGSFSYTSRAGFIFMGGVSLTHPVFWGVSLTHPMPVSLLSGEFLLHIPCCFHFMWGVSLTHPVLASFLFGEFLLHIPCWLYFFIWGCIFMWGVSLKHPVLATFLSGELLLHIPCWISFSFYLGSCSYTSRAGFMFMWGVSLTHPEFWGVALTHPMLVSLLSGEFLLHIPCWFHFMWGVSLTHPVLASFLSGEFLLHIPCWLYFYQGLHFYVGSFSYTSRAGFILIWGVSLTHPVVDYFFFYLGSFSYTPRAGFMFTWGVSLTHPEFRGFSFTHRMLVPLLFGEFLLHIQCWFHFYVGSFSYTPSACFLFIWEFL